MFISNTYTVRNEIHKAFTCLPGKNVALLQIEQPLIRHEKR